LKCSIKFGWLCGKEKGKEEKKKKLKIGRGIFILEKKKRKEVRERIVFYSLYTFKYI
jgi:hypothetical protein